jgi:hypothetical protein
MPTIDFSKLAAIVAEKNTVIDSAAVLIASLSSKLAAASASANNQDVSVLQASIDQIAHDLDVHGSALAQAIVANTPAA